MRAGAGAGLVLVLGWGWRGLGWKTGETNEGELKHCIRWSGVPSDTAVNGTSRNFTLPGKTLTTALSFLKVPTNTFNEGSYNKVKALVVGAFSRYSEISRSPVDRYLVTIVLGTLARYLEQATAD